MAKRSAVRNGRTLDPMFSLPDGMDDWAYSDKPENDLDAAQEALEFVDSEDDVDSELAIIDDGDEETHDAPPVPDNFVVLSQTLRRAPDGSHYVDLLFQVDDIPGVVKLDVGYSKV